MTLKEFDALLKTITPRVYHGDADKAAPPYAVWHEYRKVHRHADSRPQGGFWRVQVDYYTNISLDPAADEFESALADSGVAFKHSVSQDYAKAYGRAANPSADSKLTRHIFDCEVIYG